MAEDLYERLEQVGFAGTIFADKDIEKAFAIEGQGKIPQILVLANVERFHAHSFPLLHLSHHGVE